MTPKLKDYISSSYFEAAHKLYAKKTRRKIVAYVESYEDIGFWRTLLGEFENEERYFQVVLPSKSTLTKGKKQVLMNMLNVNELGKSLIACVDSDYDFLLQGATSTSRKINNSKYVLQTYAYAIESYHCYSASLHNACVQATLNDKYLINFEKFMARYSEIAYPLFLWTIWFYRNNDTHTFPIYDFNLYVGLKNVRMRNPYACLDDMEKQVGKKLSELEKEYPALKQNIIQLGIDLRKLGLIPDNTYLYMQGHHIMDNVVMKLLNPVCSTLRRQREKEIKELANHNIQYKNELMSYQNSQINILTALKKNNEYKNLFLYQWLRNDIETIL